jgi:hypothetical protein
MRQLQLSQGEAIRKTTQSHYSEMVSPIVNLKIVEKTLGKTIRRLEAHLNQAARRLVNPQAAYKKRSPFCG